ncbi:uncharacterized protein G2W53_025768 [Senna tora]|uniref:Uncharacterized protein n=1 Tax=Senna tora TaxID=362788 RepID=A0A834TE74_9FABA|nr:uncharacterized protein G2W53_025768 [Senna tora]
MEAKIPAPAFKVVANTAASLPPPSLVLHRCLALKALLFCSSYSSSQKLTYNHGQHQPSSLAISSASTGQDHTFSLTSVSDAFLIILASLSLNYTSTHFHHLCFGSTLALCLHSRKETTKVCSRWKKN